MCVDSRGSSWWPGQWYKLGPAQTCMCSPDGTGKWVDCYYHHDEKESQHHHSYVRKKEKDRHVCYYDGHYRHEGQWLKGSTQTCMCGSYGKWVSCRHH